MTGDLLYAAHRLFQACAGVVRAARSRRAWRRWQAEIRRQRVAAQGRHARTRDINRRQTDRLHAALRAGRHQGA